LHLLLLLYQHKYVDKFCYLPPRVHTILLTWKLFVHLFDEIRDFLINQSRHIYLQKTIFKLVFPFPSLYESSFEKG
jgi:hypothetical protein